ncbi:hypothetical protein DEJ47_33610 [Streptomyces venezuelae]|uniref:Uncharacterized protein n=1 Tax=Streptomyces venezuelae TaxID=54571 RepID=A0A5P2BJU6_STRVZ|nr:hypothetical protein DEJ47_33610 [Streptomyces venezuelae]
MDARPAAPAPRAARPQGPRPVAAPPERAEAAVRHGGHHAGRRGRRGGPRSRSRLTKITGS